MDPYQVWHDHWFGKDVFGQNQRYQNAGLIRRYLECQDCREAAVLVGTSLSENTTVTDLKEITGLNNAVRLLAKGSYPVEHKYMLTRALNSGRVKVLFWEIYRNYVTSNFDQFPNANSFPVHLYTKAKTDDFAYFLNHDLFRHSIKLALGRSDWISSTDSLNSWHNKALKNRNYQIWNSPEVLVNLKSTWEPMIVNWQKSEPQWLQDAPVFDQYIVPIVENYPEVQFVFFIPPVSLVRQTQDGPERLSAKLALRKKLAALATAHRNVSLYAFDDYQPLVSDMAYYKDPGHYTKGVDRWILERMADSDQRFSITSENVREYGSGLWQLVLDYVPTSSCETSLEICGIFDPNVLPQSTESKTL